jgi:hypothetical protein
MQIAVIRKAGEWIILRDALPLGAGVTRSAAIEIAHALRFQAEAQGEAVEFVVQDLIGGLTARYSGDDG